MRIIGIDPGTRVTGYGVIERIGSEIRTIDFGVIRTNSADAMPTRLKQIHDEVLAKVDEHKPHRLALETAFYQKNVQSTMKLGQVRGALMVLAMNKKILLSEYSPREVKKAVTGRGNAAKEQVAFMVKRILNLNDLGKFLDASDALALAICESMTLTTKSHLIQNGELHSIRSRTHSKDWKSFLDSNPHLIIAQK